MNRHDYILYIFHFGRGYSMGHWGLCRDANYFSWLFWSWILLSLYVNFVSVFIQCTRMCLRVYEFVHVARRVTHLLQATVDVDLIFYIKTFIIWLYRVVLFSFSTFISFQLMYFIHNSLNDISFIAFCIKSLTFLYENRKEVKH